jgi:precorrin-3B methylase
MQTIVVVGNSQTYTYGAYMITPRGYQDKYRGQVSGEKQGSGARD